MPSYADRVARNVFFSFLTTSGSLGLSFVLSVVIARWLGPTGQGAWNLVGWTVGTLALLVNLGLPNAVVKGTAEWLGKGESEVARALVYHAIRLALRVGLTVTLAGVVAAPWISRLYGGAVSPALLAFGALAILPSVLNDLLGAAWQGAQRFEQVTRITLAVGPLNLLVTIAVLWAGGGVPGLVACWAAGLAISAAVYWLGLRRSILAGAEHAPLPPAARAAFRRYVRDVSLMVFLDAIVFERSEVFFLGVFSSAEQVAFYTTGFAFATLAMRFLPGALTSAIFPAFSEQAGAGDQSRMARTYAASFKYLAIFTVPMAIGGALLSEAIVVVIFGERYRPAGLPLALMLVSAALARMATAASSLLYGSGHTGVLVRLGAAAAALNVGLDLLLIPRFGARGAALANGIAQLAAVGFLPLIIRRLYGFGAPWPALSKIVLAAAIMALPVAPLAPLATTPAALAAVVALGALVYAGACLLLGVVSAEERRWLGRAGARLTPSRRRQAI